jgi:glycosyltransferase involved in cell wall biosynthesis
MVVHAYYPHGETRVQREAEALVEKGYEVDVLCLRQKGERITENINGAHVFRLPVRRHKGRGILVQFMEYLSFLSLAFFRVTWQHFKNRYPVLQLHNLPDFLVFAALIPRLMGARIILDIHDLMPEFFASRFKSGMNSTGVRLVRWQEKISCLFSHHVITVTELWRQNLIQRGLPPSKCSVVMNTADDRHFTPDIFAAKEHRNNALQLIYHGTLTYHNGIDIILKALCLLSNELPGLRLTIHGTGEYLETLQSLAHELKLNGRVIFSLDFVPVEDLPAFLASFDLGIVPTRKDIFADGILPTKLMEYAALGMPTIASRTSAITSYFDETMIELFEPEDTRGLAECINALCQNHSRYWELSDNIQKFTSRYNWMLQKAEYSDLVRKLGES